jgi:hypothetical protein
MLNQGRSSDNGLLYYCLKIFIFQLFSDSVDCQCSLEKIVVVSAKGSFLWEKKLKLEKKCISK